MSTEPKLLYCATRIADDEIHIECRFADGQKHAAIAVGIDYPDLADRIVTLLNRDAEREAT